MASSSTDDQAPPLCYKSAMWSRMALEQMNEMRAQEHLCDVILVVGDKQIKSHRFLLAACSNYFRGMFTNKMIESKQYEIQMVDINFLTLEALVEYCYTGSIVISESNVQTLLPAACLLQLREIQDVCCEYLKNQLDANNCIGIRAFADTYACRDLYKAADRFMTDNFQDVVGNEEFLTLTTTTLIDILRNDELNVKSEEQIYNGVMQWVRHDLEQRRHELPLVIKLVGLVTCTAKFLINVVSDEALIKSDLACRDLVDEAKNQLLVPSARAEKLGMRTNARKPCFYGQLLYAVGGWCSGDALASVERMDARTGRWFTVASMSKRRCGVGVAVLNGILYAVGGHDGQKYLRCVESYDPLINKWRNNVANTSKCRTSVGVATLDGLLYAVGGQDGVSCLNIVERYNPHEDEWESVPPMNSKRLGVSVSVLDGCLYAVGGAEGQCPLNTVERYDPRTGAWNYVRSMFTPRKHLGSALYDGMLYACGGRAEQCELNTCERYDTRNDLWEPVTSMKDRRSGVGLAVVNDQIYAVGGFDGTSYLKTVEVYDDNEEPEWNYLSSMSCRRLGGGVGVVAVTNDQLAELSVHDSFEPTASFDPLF